MKSPHDLPYGVALIDPKRSRCSKRSRRVACFVKSCTHQLRSPTRQRGSGDACPVHGIYCHRTGTYRYADERKNLIVDADFFMTHLRHHPSKFESHRFGHENSEDAVTWNVFRSFQKGELLQKIAALATGRKVTQEPELYLWGLRIEHDKVGQECEEGLANARKRFESHLPVNRPLTEPDIMLYEPGAYLVLIEAKFTSANGIYKKGPRRRSSDLTLEELLSIYSDPALTCLDCKLASSRKQVAYQLWRNMIFAEWIAREDGCGTEPYHANLVRQGLEVQSAAEFHTLLSPDRRHCFRQITWEQIYQIAKDNCRELDRLCRYMEDKTASLARAFQIPVGVGQ